MVNLDLLNKQTHQGGKSIRGEGKRNHVMTPGVDNPFTIIWERSSRVCTNLASLHFCYFQHTFFLSVFLTLIGSLQAFFTMVRVLSCFFPVPKSQSNGSLHLTFWVMSCRMVEGASPGVCPASGGSSSFGRPPGTIVVG